MRAKLVLGCIGLITCMLCCFNQCLAQSEQGDHDTVMQQFRESMVSSQLVARGIKDAAVLAAFRTVPRHRFIPEDGQKYAYADHPVSIGHNQTISQPYMVALMTELLDLKPGEKVLEIGTGSGYQAAILAELVGQERVFTIEIIKPLGQEARQTLQKNGYGDIHCLIGDGYLGWPDNAPFDGIVVTAAPTEIPKPLVDQLAEGGHLVVPVDNEHGYQTLKVITKKDGKIMVNDSIDCRFVPFLGEHGKSMPPE